MKATIDRWMCCFHPKLSHGKTLWFFTGQEQAILARNLNSSVMPTGWWVKRRTWSHEAMPRGQEARKNGDLTHLRSNKFKRWRNWTDMYMYFTKRSQDLNLKQLTKKKTWFENTSSSGKYLQDETSAGAAPCAPRAQQLGAAALCSLAGPAQVLQPSPFVVSLQVVVPDI